MINTDEIKVHINKKEEALAFNSTPDQLMQQRKLKKAAVWVNGKQLLRSEYSTYIIHDGDDIKLLRIMAGG